MLAENCLKGKETVAENGGRRLYSNFKAFVLTLFLLILTGQFYKPGGQKEDFISLVLFYVKGCLSKTTKK